MLQKYETPQAEKAGNIEIAVLDAALVTRGTLSFQSLEALGRVRVYPATAPEERLGHIGSAQAIFVNRTRVDESLLLGCPSLRFVGVTGTGYNMVDLEAAARHGVTVCNVPAYSTDAVAQMTFALLLEITRSTSRFNSFVHAGKWEGSAGEELLAIPSLELCGKTLGVVGMGDIGRKVLEIGRAFGMRTLGCRRPGTRDADCVDLDTVLRESDVLSLHCPLTRETRGLIGAQALRKMKPGAILLNTARGPVLDEAAVREALDSGKLYAAGLDVLSQEPPGPDHPLARHPRCVVTPHVAWAPDETRRRLIDVCCENLRLFLAGTPQNVVNS